MVIRNQNLVQLRLKLLNAQATVRGGIVLQGKNNPKAEKKSKLPCSSKSRESSEARNNLRAYGIGGAKMEVLGSHDTQSRSNCVRTDSTVR